MIQALFEFLFEILLGLTGYGVLFVVSYGRIRPNGDNEGLATFVGLAFWVLVGVILYFAMRE